MKGKSALILLLLNILNAVIGVAKGLLIARLLGPAPLGVVALVTGITDAVANFVDVRLYDVASVLYFAPSVRCEKEKTAYQRRVIQAGFILQTLFAVILFVLSIPMNFLLLRFFTDYEMRSDCIISIAAAQALSYAANFLFYVQRLTGALVRMGLCQLIGNILAAGALCAILFVHPNVAGYSFGMLASAVTVFGATLASSVHIWYQTQGIHLLSGLHEASFGDYVRNLRMIVFTNVLGYAKLLHRAGDVLFVGYLFDDRETGIYKLARQITDALSIVYDSMNKVYQPNFLALAARKAWREYAQLARSIMLIIGSTTVIMLGLQILGLRAAFSLVFGNQFLGVEPLVLTLTISFFLVGGLHIWIWPLLLSQGRIGEFTCYSFVAVVVGQYGLSLVLFYGVSRVVIWCALGYVLSDVLLYAFVLLHIHRAYAEFSVAWKLTA